jgi:hypothetical protein
MRAAILLVVLAVGALATDMPSHISLPPYYEVRGSHYDAFYDLGTIVSESVKYRHANDPTLQTVLIPFYKSSEGRAVYDAFLNNNNATFPDYVREMEGLAAGAGVPFYEVFLENLFEEFSYFTPKATSLLRKPLHCSDYAVKNEGFAGVGHNEDGSPQDLNHTTIVHFVIEDEATNTLISDFTTYIYAGHLPTAAWGFNEHGVAFTMNYVAPAEAIEGGIARIFIARDLFQAVNIEDAFGRILRDDYSCGHNYQLMDVTARRVYNVEVAPHGENHIMELRDGDSHFHANMYLTLNISQISSPSSLHRQARAAVLPAPKTGDDILGVLGDYGDKDFPLYQHGGDSDQLWTLNTVLFDLDARTATIYIGNPLLGKVWSKLNVPSGDRN